MYDEVMSYQEYCDRAYNLLCALGYEEVATAVVGMFGDNEDVYNRLIYYYIGNQDLYQLLEEIKQE